MTIIPALIPAGESAHGLSSAFLFTGILLITILAVFGVLLVFVARYLKKRHFIGEDREQKTPFSPEELREMRKKDLITNKEHEILRKNMANINRQKGKEGKEGNRN